MNILYLLYMCVCVYEKTFRIKFLVVVIRGGMLKMVEIPNGINQKKAPPLLFIYLQHHDNNNNFFFALLYLLQPRTSNNND